MTTSIFIVSFLKDAQWLYFCLQSIRKFAKGFKEVVVLVPEQDWAHMARMIIDNRGRPVSYVDSPPPYGHLRHCAEICNADLYCDSDLILFMDSDCIFAAPVTPETYMEQGKPVLLVQSYASLGADPNSCQVCCWQKGTGYVLGIRATHETMRRHPAVHWRWLFKELREYIQHIHGEPMLSFAMKQKHDNPVGFGDFNVLGSYAYEFCKHAYRFVDLEKEPWPYNPLLQYWSHSPPGNPQEGWRNGKKCQIVPLEEINSFLR